VLSGPRHAPATVMFLKIHEFSHILCGLPHCCKTILGHDVGGENRLNSLPFIYINYKQNRHFCTVLLIEV
jgi:hypothetical protein